MQPQQDPPPVGPFAESTGTRRVTGCLDFPFILIYKVEKCCLKQLYHSHTRTSVHTSLIHWPIPNFPGFLLLWSPSNSPPPVSFEDLLGPCLLSYPISQSCLAFPPWIPNSVEAQASRETWISSCTEPVHILLYSLSH